MAWLEIGDAGPAVRKLQRALKDEPACAAQLLALFIGDRELQIKTAVLEGDLRRARRLVTGGSHGLDVFVDAWRIGELLTDDDGDA